MATTRTQETKPTTTREEQIVAFTPVLQYSDWQYMQYSDWQDVETWMTETIRYEQTKSDTDWHLIYWRYTL